MNSEAENGTGIGVVGDFSGAAGMMHWPNLKIATIVLESRILKHYKVLSQFAKLATT